MKTPLLLALAFTASTALASTTSAGPTIEGSVGNTSFSRTEFTPTVSDTLQSGDWDTHAVSGELGGSYPVYAWLDGYGAVSFVGSDPFEREDVTTVFATGKRQQHHIERTSRQVGLAVGLDLHTPQGEPGLSAGARVGYSLWQQRLTHIKTLTLNEVPTDTTTVGTSVKTSGEQLITAPVLSIYAQYQYDNHNSVRLFINQTSYDVDDEDIYPRAAQGARLEQDMRTVGLMFRHSY